MRFASVAEIEVESLVVTLHGKPDALIEPITEQDLEHLEWKGLTDQRLTQAWEGEEDEIYDYL